MSKLPIKHCLKCGVVICKTKHVSTSNHKKKMYCSYSCSANDRLKTRHCIQCMKPIAREENIRDVNYKRKLFCSVECSSKSQIGQSRGSTEPYMKIKIEEQVEEICVHIVPDRRLKQEIEWTRKISSLIISRKKIAPIVTSHKKIGFSVMMWV